MFATFVNEARGPVHSGPGPQYNTFHLQAAEARLRVQVSRGRLAISKDDRERLYQRFVPPPRMRQARSELRGSQTVLVDGLPGSGRRAAALMLLHELSGTRGSLHELPDTSDDRNTSPLDTRDINDGDRLLLDLSEVDESRYLAIQKDFPAFRESLIGHDAHLAVVLPHHLGYLRHDELRRFIVEIGRPSARRLLVRHLRCEGMVPSADELAGPELTAYLPQAPVREVAELADRIRRRRNSAGPERGFSDWLSESLADLHDQTARVAADLSNEQDGHRRALLLALAMFHGTTPATVLQSTNALLGVLSHPPDPAPRLDRADLHAEFMAIGAETQPNGRVFFRLAGYDRAVRDHFWTFLPDIRRQLRDWFRTCLKEPGLTQSEREEAVARFTAQSLRTGRPQDLIWLAEQWTSGSTSAHLVPDAAQVLALGLDDDQHGRYFRQRIYDWATVSDTGDTLRRVLVLVCSATMARSHPDQALVRLHHLARRAEGPTGVAAQGAVLRLARSENRLYQRMLDRLSTSIAQKRWPADFKLFLAVADPVRLIGSQIVRDSLTLGWAGAVSRPVEFWAPAVAHWLNSAGGQGRRDFALDVLVAACATDSHVSGRLYRVALDWQREGPDLTGERANTVYQLLEKINTAQGIESYEQAV
ncbi:ABC transporter substrate-binding protein [Streptomyces sp. NPDC050535]|uniref:ABC transporter substrate-binding protein n=1 Tax=Streptomyces sp. NPDC050535 TaxID=3365626 RepID=UPI0037A5E3C0